jgi:hypothetical protein
VIAALVRYPASPHQMMSGPPPVQPRRVRTVYMCGFPQPSALVAAAASGAGVSSVPSTSAARSASFRASPNPAAVYAASRGARHRDTSPRKSAPSAGRPSGPLPARSRSRPCSPATSPRLPRSARSRPAARHTRRRRGRNLPAPQVRFTPRYSVTVSAAGGISKTCTAEASRPVAPARPAPHPPQVTASTATVSSGRLLHARFAPGWPFCPPRGQAGGARRASRQSALSSACAAGPSWLGAGRSSRNPGPPVGAAPPPRPAAPRSARPAPPPPPASSWATPRRRRALPWTSGRNPSTPRGSPRAAGGRER